MNFMGVGSMELLVILLIAFLVLGPGRSIDMARRAGKVLGDLRRTFTDVTDAITVEDRQRGHPQAPPPGVPSRPEIPDEDEPAPAQPTTRTERPPEGT